VRFVGQPDLEVLDVIATHRSDRAQARVIDHPAGELAQRILGHDDAGRGLEGGQPLQIPLHRHRDLRGNSMDLHPLRRRRAARDRAISDRRGNRLCAHRALTSWTASIASPAAVSASISADARRYSSASQSLVRCR
jgi:hypothetical protein